MNTVIDRAALAIAANDVSAKSWRAGAPGLTSESTRDQIAAWLQWCDPNGTHTADPCRCDGTEASPADRCSVCRNGSESGYEHVDDAWEAVASMLSDS